MDELQRIRKLYKLKSVYRDSSVGNRKESSAEHSWSCLMLADYFIEKMNLKIDRIKVYELLMYHDLVEIEAGDTPIHHEHKRVLKKEMELKASEKLKEEIPKELKKKYAELFNEFEECKTKEAKFAKAIDKLDATIHEMDCKEDWKGWTEEMLRRYNDKIIGEFLEMKELNEKIIKILIKEGYFTQI